MADVATAPNAQQQVPLDTIPISPSDKPSDSTEATESTAPTSSNEIRTVFDDPDNFNVKHPLMNTWTLWFTKPPSGKVYFRQTFGLDIANKRRATTGLSF
jgi:translation initiation factor 4E